LRHETDSIALNKMSLEEKPVPLYFRYFRCHLTHPPFTLGRNVSNILISAIQEQHVLKGFAESGH